MRKKQLLTVPTELWEYIFAPLDVKDIKSVRLAWNGWTKIAVRFLFKPFVFRVDRKDLERLDMITSNTAMSDSINSLRFEIGTMNIDNMSNLLASEYADRCNDMIDPEAQIPLEPCEFEMEKRAAVAEYAAWNVRWHKARQNYRDVSTLRKLFNQLKVLDAIEMVYKATPFTANFLLESWVQGSWNDNAKKHTMEFVAILLALRGTHCQLKHLSHDQLPVALFATDKGLLLSQTTPLRNHISLHLTFDATDTPHLVFWQGLGLFLQAIPNLKDLRFGFAPFQHGVIDEGTWADSQDPGSRYVPLWKVLGVHTWKHLEILQLGGLVVCETGLWEVLERHATTLKSLSLFNIGLWQGSFEGLLISFIGVLSLKTFHVWGMIRSFHAPNEIWNLEPRYEVGAGGWPPELSSFVTRRAAEYFDMMGRAGTLSAQNIGWRLELFTTSTISWPWPLHPSDMIDRFAGLRHTQKRHSSDMCRKCVLSREEVEIVWNRGIGRSTVGWRDNEAEDLPGVSEEEIENFYEDEGFDHFGFNSQGYNAEGVHHLDFREEWQDFPNALTEAAAWRLVLEDILSHIPRYAKIQRKRSS
jgi:hypothetical protein